MELFKPESYKKAPKEFIDSVAGGCGPGGFGDVLVPDKLIGLSVKEACRIHDYMYWEGATIEDKDSADRAFLNNMLRLIIKAGGWALTRYLRMRLARKYYLAVKIFGGPAFWS